MYARSVPATWERSNSSSSSDEARVVPEEHAEAQPPTTAALRTQPPEDFQRQPWPQRDRHQHQHGEQQQHDATQISTVSSSLSIPTPIPIPISKHSPPPPTDTPLPETSTKLSPGRAVEGLARKLSEQNLLQLSASSGGRLHTQQPTPPPPPPPPSHGPARLARFRDWLEPGTDDDAVLSRLLYDAPQPANRYPAPWLSLPVVDIIVGEPIEVDEAYSCCSNGVAAVAADDRPDDRRLLDLRRPRRQPSGQLRGGGSSSGGSSSAARPIDPRLEGMLVSRDQCSVRGGEARSAMPPPPIPAASPLRTSASSSTFTPPSQPTQPPSSSSPLPPPLPPSRPTPRLILTAEPAFIEPDPECAMPPADLEVDYDATLINPDFDTDSLPYDPLYDNPTTTAAANVNGSSISLRYASNPGGIRKYTVGGVALRYRLSADAALRCANVVRSRPRMRKRHGKDGNRTGHGSTTSSVVSSPALSAAASPASPSLVPLGMGRGWEGLGRGLGG